MEVLETFPENDSLSGNANFLLGITITKLIDQRQYKLR